MTYLGNTRRNFLKTLTTTTLLSGTSLSSFANIIGEKNNKVISGNMVEGSLTDNLPKFHDGPASPLFEPLKFTGNFNISDISENMVSSDMADALKYAPEGDTVSWGIPFKIPGKIVYLKDKPLQIDVNPVMGRWFVFLHASDHFQLARNENGFYNSPFRGIGLLNEDIAGYFVIYEDGSEINLPIRQRYHIGMFSQIWGENCIESVAHYKPRPVGFHREIGHDEWGWVQTRVGMNDRGNWINWLWAWENPKPDKNVKGFRFEPLNKTPIILSAITAGQIKDNPLRWNPRQKALLQLPKGTTFKPELDNLGLLSHVKLDLGQVISAVPRLNYPVQEWSQSYNNKIPGNPENEVIIEFSGHPEARFHLEDNMQIPISDLIGPGYKSAIQMIKPSDRKVRIRVVEKESGMEIPVKFHAHGESDEYLAPMNRHRIPNNAWFQDYSSDYVNEGMHNCTYIPGIIDIKLPLGKVYIEISKGFEIKPIRKVFDISAETESIQIDVEKTLHWREKGWVSADTHVHFLSPQTAMLEGEAEGVNIVNLLASQWGELMTNVGDFDGKTTVGSTAFNGKGEYFVRVGTENRQHVMGHISLLGYDGNMITPMTTGGPDESAIGDPIEILLTEWALQCKKQNGVVVLPHFPNPRMENASAIISGGIDGVEMTSWGDLYSGIDPYSLTDWYRYLNCGYFVAAVGGTDKMSADTAVGTVRTYAKIPDNQEFTYEAWKDSIRNGHTFVSYGPLVNFSVDGKVPGNTIEMSSSGGTVDISWEVASVTIPMTRVELIVSGELRESVTVPAWKGSGNWKVKVPKSSWTALLIRGHYPDKPEIITAHTSPVMIKVKDSTMLAAADSLTILEQIEGSMAYLDTIGTRAEDKVYKRMKMVLTSAHRTIHNRMHEAGFFHQHTPVNDHPEHH